MKLSKWLIAGIVGIQLLCSCEAVRISENSNYKNSEFVFGPNKTAVIIGNDDILISEFSKTFNKKYKQKHDYVKQYDSLCAIIFKQENIFGEIKHIKSFEILLNDPITFTLEQQKKVDSLFSNTTANYLIKITSHEITNSIQGSPVMAMPMAGGGMGMSSGTQSESCIINSHFQIYDIKTRKKMLDFVSKGSGSVLFFAFEQAFIDAMNSSVKNSAIYLKTGKLKF